MCKKTLRDIAEYFFRNKNSFLFQLAEADVSEEEKKKKELSKSQEQTTPEYAIGLTAPTPVREIFYMLLMLVSLANYFLYVLMVRKMHGQLLHYNL